MDGGVPPLASASVQFFGLLLPAHKNTLRFNNDLLATLAKNTAVIPHLLVPSLIVPVCFTVKKRIGY